MTTAGTKASRCPVCRRVFEYGDRFCEACGHDTSVATGPVVQLRPFSEWTDPSCRGCGEKGSVEGEYCGVCGTKRRGARDHMEADYGSVAAVSDRGHRRSRNEDAFALSVLADGRILAVVCDGVSTTANSDAAAQAAADAGAATHLEPVDHGKRDRLDAAYAAARSAVRQIPCTAQEEKIGPPSCTFLAVAVTGAEVELLSLGDCRAFWLPQTGQPLTLTEDDSWAGEQIRAATMTAEAAHRDPRCHSITRWIGRDADPAWVPRRVSFTASGPGRVVLCSDGLWNYAQTTAEVAAVIPGDIPLAAARALVEWANARGGHDNVTVVVIVIDVAKLQTVDPTNERTDP